MAKGYITSKDLTGREGLTGVARAEAEKAEVNKKILEDAIAYIQSEKEKALVASQDLKKKKEAKKKKSK